MRKSSTHKSFLFLLFTFILVSGCGKKTAAVEPTTTSPSTLPSPSLEQPMENKPTINYLEDEKFALTTDAQDAVFYLKTNLTGGPGSTAVIDAKTGNLKMFNGKPLYVESEIASHVKAGLAPYTCIKGNPTLRVSANIKLEEKTETNDSVPGGTTQSYYEVKVQNGKLYDMNIKADPC